MHTKFVFVCNYNSFLIEFSSATIALITSLTKLQVANGVINLNGEGFVDGVRFWFGFVVRVFIYPSTRNISITTYILILQYLPSLRVVTHWLGYYSFVYNKFVLGLFWFFGFIETVNTLAVGYWISWGCYVFCVDRRLQTNNRLKCSHRYPSTFISCALWISKVAAFSLFDRYFNVLIIVDGIWAIAETFSWFLTAGGCCATTP